MDWVNLFDLCRTVSFLQQLQHIVNHQRPKHATLVAMQSNSLGEQRVASRISITSGKRPPSDLADAGSGLLGAVL
jgi:hypothetical protein